MIYIKIPKFSFFKIAENDKLCRPKRQKSLKKWPICVKFCNRVKGSVFERVFLSNRVKGSNSNKGFLSV